MEGLVQNGLWLRMPFKNCLLGVGILSAETKVLSLSRGSQNDFWKVKPHAEEATASTEKKEK